MRSLTFGVPLKSREASDVVAAVAQVSPRSVQCSSGREDPFKTAKEFSGGKFQKWCRDLTVPHNVAW